MNLSSKVVAIAISKVTVYMAIKSDTYTSQIIVTSGTLFFGSGYNSNIAKICFLQSIILKVEYIKC